MICNESSFYNFCHLVHLELTSPIMIVKAPILFSHDSGEITESLNYAWFILLCWNVIIIFTF